VTHSGQGASRGRGAVLVGIDDLPHADIVLPLAFKEAAARKAQLTSIQVSMIIDADDGPLPWTAGLAAAAHGLAASASDVLDRWASRFPDVLVNHLIIAGDAVEVLREASAAAELLVIGRRGGKARDPHTLGSRARQLISSAQSPVLVAAPMWTGTGSGQSRVAPIGEAWT